jgi:hypothetical protein
MPSIRTSSRGQSYSVYNKIVIEQKDDKINDYLQNDMISSLKYIHTQKPMTIYSYASQ